jgi:nucleotide-binding universal stress UspA family protein
MSGLAGPATGVVVGVDGTASARRAVLWAAREAVLRGCPLVVAHAYRHAGWPVNDAAEEINREQAWRLVRREAAAAEVAEPGLSVVRYAALGPVREVLYGAGVYPGLFVVGCRGRGRVASALLGSTGVDLARQALRPVVVVRSGPVGGRRPGPFAGHVVVGVDHSVRSGAALAFGFEQAVRWGWPLAAVHVGVHGGVEGWRDLSFGELHEERPDPDWQLLEAAVEPFRPSYPQVPVKIVVHQAPAVSGLLRAAAGAELLVVSTIGHSRIGGAVIGSVSRAMVTRAPCPVAVVPPPAAISLGGVPGQGRAAAVLTGVIALEQDGATGGRCPQWTVT